MFLTANVKHYILASMTNQKLYFSNLSPVWPVTRQRAVLTGIEGVEYCDELDSSERRGFRLDGLPERGQMLRPSQRGEHGQTIFVASLACLARNAEDLMLVLTQAAERNAIVRDVSAQLDIKPKARTRELQNAAKIFAEARKRAMEEVRGRTGGQKSGGLRAQLAKDTALKFEADWQDFKKTNQQIAKESGLSVNTLKLYLGRRAEARARYLGKLKRGTHAPRSAEQDEIADIPYLYLMRREDGVYKIGFSANPKQRALDLRHQFKKRFKIIQTWQRRDAYRLEKFVHNLLKKRLHLESEGWETFKAPKKVIIAAIEEAIRRIECPTKQ
jgi:DNA invertase Pin-like site-specific DNA recombinase